MARRKRWDAPHRADLRGKGFAGIPHAVLDSLAYRHLSLIERAILVEIVRTFNGFNNDRIGISYKTLAQRLNRKNEVPFAPAIGKLLLHGLVAVGNEANWSRRRAREYRITFLSTTDAQGRPVPATNEYLGWQLEKKSSATTSEADSARSTTTSVADYSRCATKVVAGDTENQQE